MSRRTTTMKTRVLDAVLSGYCNTTLDIAEETGICVNTCSHYIGVFARMGIVRKTDRRLPNSNPINRGRQLRVFEVVR